ncbi:hypothetical protein PUN28_000995 [Cardiocondyla obscurior]|uniref:Major facilitator superfamily associated domain-containing protein n=1 Tax=Cardiocondyla obscurior TaxID=286306 RepID=A0AAW2H2C6_9HYME
MKMMMMLNSFFSRICKDFRQKELIPLKLIFFVQASTLYVLYPYLTIHEVGINVEETAIMSAVTPVVAMVMPPLAGMLADRIGNFRILLAIFSAFGGLAALLLLLVPIGRMTVEFPERIVMDLGCEGRNGSLLHTMSRTYPCEMQLEPEIAIKVESCGFVPRETDNETDRNLILRSGLYMVQDLNFQSGVNTSYKYIVEQSDVSTSANQLEDLKEHRRLRNNEFLKLSSAKFPSALLFPDGSAVLIFVYVGTGSGAPTILAETPCTFDSLTRPKVED